MPRRATGSIVEHIGKDGRPYYALRFRAYGRRQYLALGPVDRARAERELKHVLADVDRGIWAEAEPAPPPEPESTFHEYAERWWLEKERELGDATRADYRWRLERHLLPFFGEHLLARITIAEVDRYKAAKLNESDALSGSSINKTLTLLSAILETAEERELIARNPARGNRRRVRTRQPRRTYLDTAGQIGALLQAASRLDAEARRDQAVPRRAMLATLTFAGLRLGEMLDLRWRDVDLAAGRLRVGEAKTDAGRRDVRLLPGLRDELVDMKASATDPQPDGLVFATAKGRRQSPSNVRRRVLARAVERANAQLEEAGELPLPEGLTPHSLRRTFASVLYALGESPAEVMAQLGHTTPGLALRLYARAMRLDEAERECLQALVDGSDWADMGRQAPDGQATADAESEDQNDETPADAGASEDGHGWFRTSDLSRVKPPPSEAD